jgi:S-DNA-T family DNA segregation ATPase FtsK/SpoIIIE
MSLLFTKHPAEMKFVMVDCKRIEFALYQKMEKHFLAKLPGKEPPIIESVKRSIVTLNALCIEMDNRYDLLKEAGCRNIKEYNSKFINRKLNPEKGHQYLPYIILVIDELANISEQGRNEIIMPLQRLLSESYKTGIISLISTNQFIGGNLPSTLVSLIGNRIVFKMYDRADTVSFWRLLTRLIN